MTTSNIKGRALAIIAGCAFAAGGFTILLDKELTHPLDWAASQWLTIIIVFGTIAAGHLMADAARARHLFATVGFFVLFMSGTGLVVYNSVGRQVEAAGTTTLSVEDTNKKIVEKSADLESAKARRDYADKAADREMTGQRCGPRCKDWKTNAKDIRIVIGQLEAEIAALGPQKPVNAKAAAMADLAAMFGFGNKPRTVAFLTMVVPFLTTLFFEIGSIVSLGFAFRSSPSKPERPVDRAGQSDFPAAEQSEIDAAKAVIFGDQPDNRQSADIIAFVRPDSPPNGSGPKPGKRSTSRKPEVLADIVGRIERGERFESQEDLRAALAERFGEISRSTLSDWLKELGQSVGRTQEGRRKIVGG